ncbi:MAG: ATP-binding protein [Candidatus Margulisiibacteriota bacterium]
MIERNTLNLIINEWKYRQIFTGTPRLALTSIKPNIEEKEIIALTGVRRCGKTTLFNQIIKEISVPENTLYINFEDERLINFTVNDFDLLLESFFEINNPAGKVYLFLDEIQEIDGWEKWVRRIHDTSDNIKIFITGSSSSLLSSEFATLLTGRNLSYQIMPFSFCEYLYSKNISVDLNELSINTRKRAGVKKHFRNYLENGGFPSVAENYRRDLLQQYFKDILFRDIVKRFRIRDVKLLEELSLYLITNTANLYSYNNLKNTFKMGIDTVKEYISYFIAANLLFEHLFFSYSQKEAYERNRKLYTIDNGLRNAVSFRVSGDTGRLAENLVFIECKRSSRNTFYYQGKNEVDFVIRKPDQSLTAMNVCYSNTIDPRETAGIDEFCQAHINKVTRKIILTDDYQTIENDIEYIPLWKWLLLPDTEKF